MAGDLNEVTLIGRLGADPEIRRTQDGRAVANLRVATSESWKDKEGERQERTEWHRVVCFNEGLCSVIEKYLGKGDKIMLRGMLKTRKWTDKEDIERYSTEVVMQGFDSKLLMLQTKGNGGDARDDGGDGETDADRDRERRLTGDKDRGRQAAGGASGRKAGSARRGDIDDEIPF